MTLETFAGISIIVRIIGSGLLLYVFTKQLKLFRLTDGLFNIRLALMVMVALPFIFNILATYNNYIRFTAGQQNEVINTISFVMGAITDTASAFAIYLIYRLSRDK